MDSPPNKPILSTPGFQFVNISEPGDMKATEHRKLVRKSVASIHRKKQILRGSTALSQGNTHRSCPAQTDDSQSPGSYCQACGALLQTRRDSSSISNRREDSIFIFAPGVVDPFNSFPIPSQLYMHVLINHYLAVYCPTLQAFGRWDSQKSPITTRLFPLAIQNPVYFHAILCISATHFGISSGLKTFKTVACHHRRESIKLLNEILQDGKDSVTDLVIAAAGSLASHDIIVGDTKALINHKEGMVAMIRIRGGIDQPDLDCLLRFRAYWIDMLSSSYTETTPSLPVDGLSSMISQQSPSIPLAETGFRCLLEVSDPSSFIIRGLQELVSFAADLRSLGDTIPSAEQLYSFTGRRSWVEWALSSLKSNSSSEIREPTEVAVETCCRVSAQIYINIVIRKMDLGYAILSHLTNKLKDLLCQTNLDSMWEDKTELLTWTLFQGGAVATNAGTRKWYVSRLVACSKYLGLQTWNDVLLLLEKFLWVSPELEKRCKPAWYEIVIGLSDLNFGE